MLDVGRVELVPWKEKRIEKTWRMHKTSSGLRLKSQSQDGRHLHDFLSKKRKEIDQKHDYRYSVLILVFARLMQEGWLKESDLEGLHKDKAYQIKALANL